MELSSKSGYRSMHQLSRPRPLWNRKDPTHKMTWTIDPSQLTWRHTSPTRPRSSSPSSDPTSALGQERGQAGSSSWPRRRAAVMAGERVGSEVHGARCWTRWSLRVAGSLAWERKAIRQAVKDTQSTLSTMPVRSLSRLQCGGRKGNQGGRTRCPEDH